MKMILLFAAALVCAPLSARPNQAPADTSASAMDAEFVAYGEWMGRLQQIETPLLDALSAIHPSWQDARAGRGGFAAAAQRMRPSIERTLTAIDTAITQLQLLDTPQFPSLDLPDDAKTVTIRDQMLQVSREMRVAVESFIPLLEAGSQGNASEAERAGNNMLQSLTLVFRSKIVMTRASLVATPSNESAWHMIHFQLLYFQTGERLMRSFRPFDRGFVDSSLATDMVRLAEQLEDDARKGTQKVDNEIAEFREILSEAEINTPEAAMLRRLITVLTIDRGYFELARELAGLLRTEAPEVRGRTLTEASLMRVFLAMRRIKDRWAEISRNEVAAMSEPN